MRRAAITLPLGRARCQLGTRVWMVSELSAESSTDPICRTRRACSTDASAADSVFEGSAQLAALRRRATLRSLTPPQGGSVSTAAAAEGGASEHPGLIAPKVLAAGSIAR